MGEMRGLRLKKLKKEKITIYETRKKTKQRKTVKQSGYP